MAGYFVVYLFLCSLGSIQEHRICSFDYFEKCGIVDKSTSVSRWAIVSVAISITGDLLCFLYMYDGIISRDLIYR